MALGSQAGWAQDGATEIPAVHVTGTRLAAPGAESPSPLQILSAADIAASGAINLQELLQKNPTLGTPAFSRNNSNFLPTGGGVASINLRNLGDARTLVLVNGRRFVAGVSGSSAVDLNAIPTDYIERIELLTGGASATYGSDAVAGVINIILKLNLSGLSFDAGTGRSSHGDNGRSTRPPATSAPRRWTTSCWRSSSCRPAASRWDPRWSTTSSSATCSDLHLKRARPAFQPILGQE